MTPRVLLVTGSLPPTSCGVGDYTQALASALARTSPDHVAILTAGALSPSAGPGVRVLPPLRSWRLAEAGAVWRTLRTWRPDVVHLQYPSQGYGKALLPSLIAPLAALAGAKVVRTWHEGFTKRSVLELLIQSLARGPYVVVRPDFGTRVSKLLKPLIAARRRVDIRSASAIPQSALHDDALTRHRGALLDGAQRLIVFFGFLYPQKGAERLFAAADPATDRIIVAGEDGVDPVYTAAIRRLADSPAWRGRAELRGKLSAPDVADLLAAADVVALPFLDGGGVWNTSIHAAVAQGTPVVTTSSAASSQQDELVRFVPTGDDAGFAAALRAVPPWRATRRPKGADDWARIAREHRLVYEDVMRTSRSGADPSMRE